MVPTSWLRRCGGPAQPAMRLICLPYAGGGASVFNAWLLPAELCAETWAVQLPGRENRRHEPPLRRVAEVVSRLATEVRPLLDLPTVLFGHSMGALLAYELCRALRAAGAPLPVRLLVSAHRAPHLPPWRPAASPLPAPQFLARLVEMAGPSASALVDPELVELLSPMIRADFELCETYDHVPAAPLRVPFSCFAAVDDPEVRVDEMTAWENHSTEECRLHAFSGGHLFLRDHAEEVLACAAVDLVSHAGSRTATAPVRTSP